MNIRWMRFVDRCFGVPLCLGLTAIRRVVDVCRWKTADSFMDGFHDTPGHGSQTAPNNADAKPVKILLVKLAEMGSTVLAIPAISRLRELFPGVQLHYVCFAENCGVLDLMREIPIEAHTIRSSSLPTMLWDTLRVIWRLRCLRLDAAIDLEFFVRASAALMYASGAPVRVGYHRFTSEGLNCGDLYTHRVTFNSFQHTSEAFLTLIESMIRRADEVPLLKQTITAPEDLPPLVPTNEERDVVLQKLKQCGYPIEERPRILILNANASDLIPLRRWPLENFELVAERCLVAYKDLWIVLTGSPSEAEKIEALREQIGHPHVVSFAGQTTLRELVVLYTLADVLITNDSGPAHFAALTTIKTISLFGPGSPIQYAPLSKNNVSLSANLACSPCVHIFNQRHSVCTDNLCMQALTVDRVFQAFQSTVDAT